MRIRNVDEITFGLNFIVPSSQSPLRKVYATARDMDSFETAVGGKGLEKLVMELKKSV
jgi:hypothetical protein